MDAGALNCPSCGAPATRETASCAFCHTRLATATCASCFAMIFVGAKHCSHCGVAVATGDVSSADTRACPRCAVPLEATAVGDAYMDECPRCAGLWIDTSSFERITTSREHQATVAALGNPGLHHDHTHPEAVRYIPCPVCKRLMNRMNFAHCSGVIVDVCKAHGVWFDADELRQVVAFIQQGGLERARARELDALAAAQRAVVPDSAMMAAHFVEVPHRGTIAMESAVGLMHWLLSK